MKLAVMSALVLISLILMAPAAEAQVSHWGVRGGVYFEESDPFIGAEAVLPMGRSFFFNPNIEHAFGDESLTTFNADVHYDFPMAARNFLWVGAGLAGLLPEGSDLDVGLNLLVGYGVRRGTAIPYIQLKGIFASDNEVVLGGGVRF